MKYFRIFSNTAEYLEYMASESAITPNVSWCIEDEEAYCTPKIDIFNPIIRCNDNIVSITCMSAGAIIYYRLNDSGEYNVYSTSFEITADTFVQAYSEKDGKRSETVREECIYTPTHDYSQDYLTLRVLTGGTIMWKAFNTGATRTISASTDDGETWTEYTSTTGGTTINVSAGDKVLIKGENDRYAIGKDQNSRFTSGGTAYYDVEGNIMSLVSGDNFTQATSFNDKTYVFHGLFGNSNAVSAKNLILPVMTLTTCCYRALFSKALSLTEAPALPATTLAESAYTYMFDVTLISKAPELTAVTVPAHCYRGMFANCYNLNYIKCLATNISADKCTSDWTLNVAPTGTFVKDANMTSWPAGNNGIPNGWVIYDGEMLYPPTIECDAYNNVVLTCETSGADIYYRVNETGNYSAYTASFSITADTIVEAYSVKNGITSVTSSQNCIYLSNNPLEYSNRNLDKWTYGSQVITTPYSINAIDGHSSSYKKNIFNFETSFALREPETTYLWFQHADQSADIYVDNERVETHIGGYNAFFSDISEYVHSGTNNIKVALNNISRNTIAPYAGDFNFNATLGVVKLLTSPVLPSKEYGYDGFHITSTVSSAEATINIKTLIPTGASVVCKIDSGNTNVYSATSASTNAEMTFTTTIQNPHLWNGTKDPFMYTVTLDVYKDGDLYHRYIRPYGFRYYDYVFNQNITVNGETINNYTGFLLNGAPYLLRGVCMHDDLANKANALNDSDYTQEFNIIQELGCNFIRLAHYPHPKEVYDWCDRLGIIVQTEAPWVNKSTTAETEAYWDSIEIECEDMVKQHYNHPCIIMWGVGNEINTTYTNTTEGKNLVKSKIEGYRNTIRTLLPGAWVGYTISHGTTDLLTIFNSPNVDWVGGNIYVGWYISKDSNNPTSELNKRINKTIASGTPMCFSEYGAGGTQSCHSDNFTATTTSGNKPRHDIEYQMWLHEGHIAAIRNFPQLLSTSQWQLFDIAVSSREEGYKVCIDGENVGDNNSLKYLNNKGLVERDHVTKKDTFYIYKAEWSDEKFVHICGKDYIKNKDRAIKCYTNDGDTLTMYVNNVSADTATVTNHIATFTARNFNKNDVVTVCASTTSDSFTFTNVKIVPDMKAIYSSQSETLKVSYKTNSIDGTSGFSSIIIDGLEQSTVQSAYTLSSSGVHTVGYDLIDNTKIVDYALYKCYALSSITLPDSVTSIGNYAFQECSPLTSITISDNVTNIGNYAFYKCGALRYCEIGSGVTSIGSSAFGVCSKALSSITVNNSNTSYDSRNDCNAIIETNTNKLILGCKNTVIPNTVTSIGDEAFGNCTGFTSITIPSSVTSIGTSAFTGCNKLTSMTVEATVPPTLGTGPFNNTNNCIIYVPSESVNDYKEASGWLDYASRIQAIPTP